ncbi:helix-turn-helix transcriptional regulator [Patescibacteria group bacterium]|nr:helix-turn-helix transcriptional regulator [Patescibacteria group bacterium]
MDRQNDLTYIGLNIRRLRKKEGYTQEYFSKLIEMNRAYYGAIERGKYNITILNLLKIAKALNILPQDIFPTNFQV